MSCVLKCDGETMKRYNYANKCDVQENDCYPLYIESKDGDWYRFEDVEQEILKLKNCSESMKANYEESDLEVRRLNEIVITLAKHITGKNQKAPEQNRAIALAFEVLGSEHK